MKLSLRYDWDCAPEAFWALYFDPEFAVRLHLEALGSTSAEVLSQEGDLTSGLVRTLRYGQRPNMPGPVRKIFGAGPIVERFIEQQARAMQEKSVEFMRGVLEG